MMLGSSAMTRKRCGKKQTETNIFFHSREYKMTNNLVSNFSEKFIWGIR